jgi:hypothetical protein
MSDDKFQVNHFDKEKAIKDLMEDLLQFGLSTNNGDDAANEILDLMVDQVIKGIDIRQRFPAFYQKLLHDKIIRQQFIDLIAMNSTPGSSTHDPYLLNSKLEFSFLIENQTHVSGWPLFFSQTQSQLMNVFFPTQVVYRSAENLEGVLVYSLLRKDFVLDGSIYTVLINGTLAENDEALITNLSLASSNDSVISAFPVQASLRWGNYAAEITLCEAGKYPFPSIPLSKIFNDDLTQIKGDLYLTLSSNSC